MCSLTNAITFPIELLEPYEYKTLEGVPIVCGVLISRTAETATVFISEVDKQDSGGFSVAGNFERIATQLYRERLNDLRAWKIRWFLQSSDRAGYLDTIQAITLEWVIGAAPHGRCNFKSICWRALRSGDILVLLQDINNDLQRFGESTNFRPIATAVKYSTT